MTDTDADLVALAQAGDEAAFGELVHRHLDRAHAVAYRILREREDARDVVQEGFVRAWKALPGFEGRAQFGTWLVRIITNLALNRAQRDKLRHAPSLDEVGDMPSPDVPGSGGGAALGQRVADAIDGLPPVQRITFILRFQEDLSVKETAERLGCSEGAVKASAFHAIRKLRTALGDLADLVGMQVPNAEEAR